MSARVAVIIPCFNDGAYVEDAVRSVDEREPVEIAVVDDGSTDSATAAALAPLSYLYPDLRLRELTKQRQARFEKEFPFFLDRNRGRR